MRRAWGVAASDRVILVVGRMLRRKGHHVVVEAARRLKAMGLKNFVFVFAAEDQGTRYAAELWDQVLATGTSDVIRMAGPIDDLPAAYAAATVAVSAAVQPEGLQRALLEAQAMARPVIVSDLGAGPEVGAGPSCGGRRPDDRHALCHRRRRRAGGRADPAVFNAGGEPRGDRGARARLGAWPFQRARPPPS